MIEILTKDDVEELNGEKNDQYYIPGELFNGMQYNLIRLEVKWAYVAVLNTCHCQHCQQVPHAAFFLQHDQKCTIAHCQQGKGKQE